MLYFFNLNHPRARLNGFEGRIWPAGRMFDTPGLDPHIGLRGHIAHLRRHPSASSRSKAKPNSIRFSVFGLVSSLFTRRGVSFHNHLTLYILAKWHHSQLRRSPTPFVINMDLYLTHLCKTWGEKNARNYTQLLMIK